ncbi:hypothetical protein KKC88_03295 [Patescibacteria group bacterium]|nr:hypothetical protein [Patescibacteria group bacterium]MBU1673008.1 hypothetical protein [Patescibacteria group bacterium]MBU1964167.1 hypothetical protein [Patescibacteria group bacterium]
MEKQNRTFNEILLFIAFIVLSFIIYIVGVIVGYDFGRKNPNFIQLTGLEVQEGNYCQSLLPVEQAEIFSYSGIVKEVYENSLIMESEIIKDYSLYKEDVTVNFNDSTSFTEIDVTDPPPEEADYPKKDVALENITIGSFIVSTAEENIKEKTEFTASNIELIINNN